MRKVAFVKALVEFIDRYTIDPHIYVVARRVTDPQRYEIFWDREEQPRRWRLRPVGEGPWERVSSDGIIEALHQRGVDVERVEYQLRSVVLAQVVFAETLTREARELFGAEAISRAILDHQAFLEELKRLVHRYARGALRPIEGGGERSTIRGGHLSLGAPSMGAV
jgi:hypothetical protein